MIITSSVSNNIRVLSYYYQFSNVRVLDIVDSLKLTDNLLAHYSSSV